MTAAPISFSKRRFKKFHNKCIGFCSSQKQFKRNFDISQNHIIQQGNLKNPQRLALNRQHFAAIIQQGELNLGRCQERKRPRIAIEGKFCPYRWTEMTSRGIIEHIEKEAQVRVVIQEGFPKQLIVTAYVLDPPENRDFKEVNYDIW